MRTTMLLFTICLTIHGFAQSDALRKKHFNLEQEVALGGYDPVSYFSGRPMEGKPELKAIHRGVVYQFVSRANLDKFKTSPGQYEPMYGGWCAYAMGENGEKVKIDPETFKILEGRLYLFYNFWGNNTLKDWNEMEKELKAAADKNWVRINQ